MPKLSRRLALGLLASAACGPVLAQTVKLSKEPEDYLKAPAKPASIKGPFSLVAIGDLLNSRPTADIQDAPFQKALEIVRGGDVAIGNREGVILDLPTFKGQPYGNGQMYGEASLAGDMKVMGVDMVSMANNHSTDWGWEGVIEAGRLLDGVGIVHAGSGLTLAEARRAGIMTTPKGKVALVSTASTFKVNAGANDALEDVPARPGISTLRLRKVNLVNAEQLAAARALATERASPLAPAPRSDARDIEFGGEIYRLAPTPGSGPRIAYEMELYDQAALLRAVREAKAAADLVVFSIHAHESPTGLDDDTPAPPDFLLKLFHQCVDAGADVIQGGGPHALRGIEIYKGKPILYGMGLFMLKAQIKAMQETVFRMWPDLDGHPPKPGSGGGDGGGTPARWLEGVIAVVDYDARGREKQVRLYPLDLSGGGDRKLRGLPRLAEGETATRILAELQADSDQFGTRIQVKDGVGVIRIR